MKRILIIGGSDTSAGAGIQADLKTASAIGVYGLTTITALTSQNTKGVSNILYVPKEHVKSQLEAIRSDIAFDGVKIGMLGTADAASAVLAFLKKTKKPFVLDPVMVAQSGSRLSPQDIFSELLSLCDLATPNAVEAEALTGIKIKTPADMEKAARKLAKTARRVLVKGGDTAIDCDVYAEGDRCERLPIRRIQTTNNHGSGCTLASAIASYYVLTGDFRESVMKARLFVRSALAAGVPLGSRFGTLDQFATLENESMKYQLLKELREACETLKGKGIGSLIPEIQSNFVYIMPYGDTHADVAGFPGRIIRHGDEIHTLFCPEFGASRHVANVIIAAHRHFPQIRSAIALRYSPDIVKQLKKARFSVGSFDRRQEPRSIKEQEGSSLDWGVNQAFSIAKKPLDAVYDEGDVGKEPVIRLFGTSPADVASKVIKIRKLVGEME